MTEVRRYDRLLGTIPICGHSLDDHRALESDEFSRISSWIRDRVAKLSLSDRNAISPGVAQISELARQGLKDLSRHLRFPLAVRCSHVRCRLKTLVTETMFP